MAIETVYGRNNAFWLIDGKTFPKLTGRGIHTFGTLPICEFALSKTISIGSQMLTDVPARLADMEMIGICF